MRTSSNRNQDWQSGRRSWRHRTLQIVGVLAVVALITFVLRFTGIMVFLIQFAA